MSSQVLRSAIVGLQRSRMRGVPAFEKKSKEEKKSESEGLYVEHHIPELLQAANVAVADPNKRDLLSIRHMQSGRTMRYTINQRARETKSRRFQRHRQKLKRQRQVDGTRIDHLESAISTHKTMDLDRFCNYLIDSESTYKNQLESFYANFIHGRWRWHSYIGTQRSEAKLVKAIERLCGGSYVMVLGYWNDARRTNKFQAPTKTKGYITTTFSRHHVKCFLLDEFRTTALCPLCPGRVQKGFKRRPSSRT